MYIETILKLIFVLVIIGAFVVSHIASIRSEKKNFNKGMCPHCKIKLRCFDMDSQGGRGYTCDRCEYTTWVSHHSVDKDFEDEDKIFKKKKL